jgi:hypothetical protein
VHKRDVEKVLLGQESFRRTLLLLIEGVFNEEEPDISTKILDMYHHCPLVFNDYLRLSDYVPDDPDDPDLDNETETREFTSVGCCRNIETRRIFSKSFRFLFDCLSSLLYIRSHNCYGMHTSSIMTGQISST